MKIKKLGERIKVMKKTPFITKEQVEDIVKQIETNKVISDELGEQILEEAEKFIGEYEKSIGNSNSNNERERTRERMRERER